MNKIAVFDWGDVFITHPGWMSKMARYLRIDDKRFRKFFFQNLAPYGRGDIDDETWLALLAENSPWDIDMEEFSLFYQETYYDTMTLDEEMFEMFNEIKPVIGRSAVLSNTNSVAVDVISRKFPEFFYSFHRYFFSHEMGSVKPETPIYRDMLEALNAVPILVDDRIENLPPARREGIYTLHFDRGVEDIIPRTKAQLLQFFKS